MSHLLLKRSVEGGEEVCNDQILREISATRLPQISGRASLFGWLFSFGGSWVARSPLSITSQDTHVPNTWIHDLLNVGRENGNAMRQRKP